MPTHRHKVSSVLVKRVKRHDRTRVRRMPRNDLGEMVKYVPEVPSDNIETTDLAFKTQDYEIFLCIER